METETEQYRVIQYKDLSKHLSQAWRMEDHVCIVVYKHQCLLDDGKYYRTSMGSISHELESRMEKVGGYVYEGFKTENNLNIAFRFYFYRNQ